MIANSSLQATDDRVIDQIVAEQRKVCISTVREKNANRDTFEPPSDFRGNACQDF